MNDRLKDVSFDLVVAGGGIPGVCTAILGARLGLTVALINNRTHFGGNGSMEIMINVSGAAGVHEFNLNARETGIVEELWNESYRLNSDPKSNRWMWDATLLEKLVEEKNITLFANTCIDEVQMKDDGSGDIDWIAGTQNTTETRYRFHAPIFCDDTGDGTAAYLAGAEFRYGREAKSEFGERIAPEAADDCVIPSTLIFNAEDMGHPVKYVAPSFATDFTKTDVFEYRVIPQKDFGSAKWYYELDGRLDQVCDAETILQHHREFVYGIWDYIKNSGKFDADNYQFTYISPVMGKRESRRIVGDYILTENDVENQTDFDDAVTYGGWTIDLHAIDGFYSREPVNAHIYLRGCFQIPFRSMYSKNVNNLLVEGRCMSTTHAAFGATRLIATLGTVGQANAAAAFLCKKYSCRPRDITNGHMEELQQLLLKYDQHIIGKRYTDPANLAFKAKVEATSERAAGNPLCERYIPLYTDYALSLPVKKHFAGVKLSVKTSAPTSLRYSLWKASKPENYDPAECIFEGKVDLDKSAEPLDVTLPCDLSLPTGYYFFRLSENPAVELGASTHDVSEAVTLLMSKPHGRQVTQVDLDTLKPKQILWRLSPDSLTFSFVEDEHLLEAANLTNGYSRPYLLPNLWQSAGCENEAVTLTWDEPVTFSRLIFISDNYLTRYFRHSMPDKAAACRKLTKDYDVEAFADGEWKTICEVRDNHQRFNDLTFAPVTTDRLRIRLLATAGEKYFSVAAVRVYNE